MRISLIAAVSSNGVIGRGGKLPWHLSADLRRFKQLTMGHPIIMGRKTYESIGRPLPGRTTIVVSRQPDFHPTGVYVARSLPNALQQASSSDEAFVVGGAQIYAAALPTADRLYLTEVEADVDGDTFFPALDQTAWQLVEQSDHPADDRNSFACRFLVYDRVRS
jgi:dihydrofolate reductase